MNNVSENMKKKKDAAGCMLEDPEGLVEKSKEVEGKG